MTRAHGRTMFDTRSAPPTAHPQDQPVTDQLVTNQLAREWRRLTITRQELATVRGWQLPGDEVQSLDDVLARCGYRPAPGTAANRGHAHPVEEPTQADGRDDPANDPANDPADVYLVQLLRLAATEPLAARIVLQRILPALCGLARRHAIGQTRQRAMLDELVANAWPVICAYPVDRRPRRVVPNLVRDIGFQTVVRPRRRRQADELPMPTYRMEAVDVSSVEPVIELIEVLLAARRRGIVSDADVELLSALVRRGRADLVAHDLGVTPRTVRNHRDAAVHRLRNFVADAA